MASASAMRFMSFPPMKMLRLVLHLEADPDRDLELGDLAVPDRAAELRHLEPARVLDGLGGLLDGDPRRVREARLGRAHHLDLLVDAGHAAPFASGGLRGSPGLRDVGSHDAPEPAEGARAL